MCKWLVVNAWSGHSQITGNAQLLPSARFGFLGRWLLLEQHSWADEFTRNVCADDAACSLHWTRSTQLMSLVSSLCFHCKNAKKTEQGCGVVNPDYCETLEILPTYCRPIKTFRKHGIELEIQLSHFLLLWFWDRLSYSQGCLQVVRKRTSLAS